MSIILIPAYPPAPEAIEFTLVSASGMVRSPFSGSQQVLDWGSEWLEANVQLPPMLLADANNWLAFLQALHGPVNTFQFSSAFVAAYPLFLKGGSPLASLYWRLKSNSAKYSLNHQRVFGFQFEILQVL